ncbi:MAG TPA: pyridoxal phosphate-dependent aminotransferase [Candidatus Dormibacteraeota bacterium]
MLLNPVSRAVQEAAHSGIREIGNQALRTPGAIRLEVGQPNFPTPDHIVAAAKRAMDEGWTGYTATAGLLSLRERISAKLSRVNGIDSDPETEITIGPGGVGAIAAVMAALVEPGDEVLLPDPGWPNYRLMTVWTGTTPVYYPCSAERGFEPEPEQVGALVGPRTRVLMVNSPNNPTGAVYRAEVQRALLDIAERHGLWVISDECYDELVFDGTFTSLATLTQSDRVISGYTFSKSYSMTGWRIGYAVGPANVIDGAVKILESNSSCVSTISQKAAEAALDGPQACVAEMRDAYRRRRDLACAQLGELGLLLARPSGAFYVMADVSAAGADSRDFAFRLLEEQRVAVAPGTAFGEIPARAVRISLASSDEDLAEGIARLATALGR